MFDKFYIFKISKLYNNLATNLVFFLVKVFFKVLLFVFLFILFFFFGIYLYELFNVFFFDFEYEEFILIINLYLFKYILIFFNFDFLNNFITIIFSFLFNDFILATLENYIKIIFLYLQYLDLFITSPKVILHSLEVLFFYTPIYLIYTLLVILFIFLIGRKYNKVLYFIFNFFFFFFFHFNYLNYISYRKFFNFYRLYYFTIFPYLLYIYIFYFFQYEIKLNFFSLRNYYFILYGPLFLKYYLEYLNISKIQDYYYVLIIKIQRFKKFKFRKYLFFFNKKNIVLSNFFFLFFFLYNLIFLYFFFFYALFILLLVVLLLFRINFFKIYFYFILFYFFFFFFIIIFFNFFFLFFDVYYDSFIIFFKGYFNILYANLIYLYNKYLEYYDYLNFLHFDIFFFNIYYFFLDLFHKILFYFILVYFNFIYFSYYIYILCYGYYFYVLFLYIYIYIYIKKKNFFFGLNKKINIQIVQKNKFIKSKYLINYKILDVFLEFIYIYKKSIFFNKIFLLNCYKIYLDFIKFNKNLLLKKKTVFFYFYYVRFNLLFFPFSLKNFINKKSLLGFYFYIFFNKIFLYKEKTLLISNFLYFNYIDFFDKNQKYIKLSLYNSSYIYNSIIFFYNLFIHKYFFVFNKFFVNLNIDLVEYYKNVLMGQTLKYLTFSDLFFFFTFFKKFFFKYYFCLLTKFINKNVYSFNYMLLFFFIINYNRYFILKYKKVSFLFFNKINFIDFYLFMISFFCKKYESLFIYNEKALNINLFFYNKKKIVSKNFFKSSLLVNNLLNFSLKKKFLIEKNIIFKLKNNIILNFLYKDLFIKKEYFKFFYKQKYMFFYKKLFSQLQYNFFFFYNFFFHRVFSHNLFSVNLNINFLKNFKPNRFHSTTKNISVMYYNYLLNSNLNLDLFKIKKKYKNEDFFFDFFNKNFYYLNFFSNLNLNEFNLFYFVNNQSFFKFLNLKKPRLVNINKLFIFNFYMTLYDSYFFYTKKMNFIFNNNLYLNYNYLLNNYVNYLFYIIYFNNKYYNKFFYSNFYFYYGSFNFYSILLIENYNLSLEYYYNNIDNYQFKYNNNSSKKNYPLFISSSYSDIKDFRNLVFFNRFNYLEETAKNKSPNSYKFYNTRFDYTLNFETIILYKFLWKESFIIDQVKNVYLQIENVKKYDLNFFFSKKLAFFYNNLINKNYNQFLLEKTSKYKKFKKLDEFNNDNINKDSLKVIPYSIYDYINRNSFNFRNYYFNLFLDTYDLKLYNLNFTFLNLFLLNFFDFYFKYLLKIQTLSYILKYEYNLLLPSNFFFGPVNLNNNLNNSNFLKKNSFFSNFCNFFTLNLFTFKKIILKYDNLYIYNLYYIYVYIYFIYLGFTYKKFLNELNKKSFFLRLFDIGSDYASVPSKNTREVSSVFETHFNADLNDYLEYFKINDLTTLNFEEISEYFGLYNKWSTEVFNSLGFNNELEDIDYKYTIGQDSPFFNFKAFKNFVYFKLIIYYFYFYDILALLFFYVFFIFILDILSIIFNVFSRIFFFFLHLYGLCLYFVFSFFYFCYNFITFYFFYKILVFPLFRIDFYLYVIYYFNFFFVLIFESFLLFFNFKYFFRFINFILQLKILKLILTIILKFFKFLFFNFLIYFCFYYSLINYDSLFIYLNKNINISDYNPIYYIYSVLYFILIFFFLDLNFKKLSKYFWELRYIYVIIVLTMILLLQFSNNLIFLLFNFFDTNIYLYYYYYLKYNIINNRFSQAAIDYLLLSNDTYFNYHLYRNASVRAYHIDTFFYKKWLSYYSDYIFSNHLNFKSNKPFLIKKLSNKIDYFFIDPFFFKSFLNAFFKATSYNYKYELKDYTINPTVFYSSFNQINSYFINYFNNFFTNIFIFFNGYIINLMNIVHSLFNFELKIPNVYINMYKVNFEKLYFNLLYNFRVNTDFYIFYKNELVYLKLLEDIDALFLPTAQNNLKMNNLFLNKEILKNKLINNLFLTIFLSELGYTNKLFYYKYLVNLFFFEENKFKTQISEAFIDFKEETEDDFLYFLLQYNKNYYKTPLLLNYITKEELIKVKSYRKKLDYLVHYDLKKSLWNEYEGDISNYVLFYGNKWNLQYDSYKSLTLAQFFSFRTSVHNMRSHSFSRRTNLYRSTYSYFAYPRLYKNIEESKLISSAPKKQSKFKNALMTYPVYTQDDNDMLKGRFNQVLPSAYHYPREYLIYKNYDILPEKLINDIYFPDLSYNENTINLDALDVDEGIKFPEYLYNYSKYIVSIDNYNRYLSEYNLNKIEFIPMYMFYNFVDFIKYHDYQDFINIKSFKPFKRNIEYKPAVDLLFHKYFIPDFGFYGSDLWLLSINNRSFAFDSLLEGPSSTHFLSKKKLY